MAEPKIDFSEFRRLNNFNDKQPLFPFVEVTLGGVTVSDFDSEYGGSVMDLSYRRTAHQDITDASGDTFTLTLYDDTAIQVESLIYSVILRTTHQAEENLNDTNSSNNTVTDGNSEEDSNNSGSSNESDNTLNTDTEDEDTDEKSSDEAWVEALEEINNIDINYGWVDMRGNRMLDRNINGNYSKYSMEFEGASTILTIEGQSVASAGLNSPSTSWISEYPASEFQGNPTKIVKSIIDATPKVKYTKDSIEETEPILGEDGKPKSFTRNGETPEEFIKKNLCEEAKSKSSGKVGYQFFVNKDIAYFIPNATPKDVAINMVAKTESSSANVEGTSSIDSSEYDVSSSGIDLSTDKLNTLGASLQENKEFKDYDEDEYDELDEYDEIEEEEDEYDLPEDIDDILGLSYFKDEDLEELSFDIIDSDLGDFESDPYQDMEYDITTDSIIDADANLNPEEELTREEEI